MCGRYTITISADTAREDLGIVSMPDDYQPRYNVAPTQPVAVVTDSVQRAAAWMHWGLIPFWAKDPSIASRLINARSETVMEKPAFKNAFHKRRCLILADGFYEWQKGSGPKGRSQPFYFKRNDEKAFAFAGLWEFWRSPEGLEIRSCTILTCDANDLVRPVHPRMPVMLSGDDLWAWLSSDLKPDELQSLLRSYPPELMMAYPVSLQVNRPDPDSPELIKPLAA
jgi:putative SOS response-associated peptidase YedK